MRSTRSSGSVELLVIPEIQPAPKRQRKPRPPPPPRQIHYRQPVRRRPRVPRQPREPKPRIKRGLQQSLEAASALKKKFEKARKMTQNMHFKTQSFQEITKKKIMNKQGTELSPQKDEFELGQNHHLIEKEQLNLQGDDPVVIEKVRMASKKREKKDKIEGDKDQKEIKKRPVRKPRIYTEQMELDNQRNLLRLEKISRIIEAKKQRVSLSMQGRPVPQRKVTAADVRQAQSARLVPVDPQFPRPKEVRVYVDAKNVSYSATYNYSNVDTNTNKFYVMQVLQSLHDSQECFFFTKWGRVGVANQGLIGEVGPITIRNAIDRFNQKVLDKKQKGYRKIQNEYQETRKNFYFSARKEKKTVELQSKLDPKLQYLIKLLFDLTMMKSQLNEAGCDLQKMPLGKLHKNNIIRGYESLKSLLEELRGPKRKEFIGIRTNDFYAYIPHSVGMKNMMNYKLDTEAKVMEKLQLLQSIQDIQVFKQLTEEVGQLNEVHEYDANYKKLGVDIVPMAQTHPAYDVIMRYVRNTHAETHKITFDVTNIYEIDPQEPPFECAVNHNKHLLWHGSRLTNYVGILKEGLRIAPPEAPATGYMFGKGVYFADVVSKSANYCHMSTVNPIGCLLLCEVALGDPQEKGYADYYANLQMSMGVNSTKGIGRHAPMTGEKLQGDVYVPNGPIVETGIANTSLQYNEYVVYDTKQIRIRYLLTIRLPRQ